MESHHRCHTPPMNARENFRLPQLEEGRVEEWARCYKNDAQESTCCSCAVRQEMNLILGGNFGSFFDPFYFYTSSTPLAPLQNELGLLTPDQHRIDLFQVLFPQIVEGWKVSCKVGSKIHLKSPILREKLGLFGPLFFYPLLFRKRPLI